LNQAQDPDARGPVPRTFLQRLQQRGVLRVAISYAVIAWLTLQIGDVVLEPIGAPGWVMRALIVVVVAGFPIALLLAWYFELTPSGIQRDTFPEAAERPAVRGRRRYTDVVIIGVLLLTVIVLLARQGGLLEEERGPPVIGVLPFTELDATEDEAYFGTGLADTLTYKLGQLKQLMVLAPSSTREFRGSDQDLRVVGAKLGATVLLEGTVRRAAGSLRVNARLVDTANGQQLWSGSYDRAGTDLFAVQDEIAQSVTDALHLVLNPQESQRLADPQTDSLRAYDAYLQGRAALAVRTAASIRRAVDHFSEATRLDPDFGLAWGSLAEAIYLSTGYRRDEANWPAVSREARAAAGKAQALDPDSGEAWLAQAFVAIGDNQFGDGTAWPQSHIVTLLQKAVELSPNNAVALKALANVLVLDSPGDGLAMLERAAALDPRSAIIRMNVGDTYMKLDNSEEALRAYRQTLRIDPDFMLGYVGIIDVYDARGEFDQAARWARAFYRQHTDHQAYFAYSSALAKLAAWDEFAQLIASNSRMPATADRDGWPLLHLRAQLFYGLVTRDCGMVIASIRNFGDPVPAEGEPWPDVTKTFGGEPILTARAFCEWVGGRPESALNMLQSGIPNLDLARTNAMISFEFRTNVLFGALLKASGHAGEARRALLDFLEQTADLPVVGQEGIGFGRFFAWAVLGDADAALAELDLAIEAGYSNDWWTLDLLDADPDFAKVIADPRFAAIRGKLEDRIRPMRESYLANPELPAGYSIR
jgi:TolB-like protein